MGELKSSEQLEERFLNILSGVMENRGLRREIKLDLSLQESLGLDSMGRLELLIEIEKEFQIEFEEEYWGTNAFGTPREILSYVRKEA